MINAAGFGGEVLGYQRKTDTAFEGLTRGLYGTSPNTSVRAGRTLTSFEAMLIPERSRDGRLLPPREIRNVVKDMASPLMRQRSSDLYVVVVRLPDRPHLRRSAEEVQLIPGENAWETYGYHVFKDGKKMTGNALRPGASLTLPGNGTYTAVAVEWSGLESQPSLPLTIARGATLTVVSERPSDFSWTRDQYLVQGKEVSEQEAKQSEESVRETIHLHDGVFPCYDRSYPEPVTDTWRPAVRVLRVTAIRSARRRVVHEFETKLVRPSESQHARADNTSMCDRPRNRLVLRENTG